MSFAPPLFTALIERLAKAHNANVERRMSVVVTGLADTVRQAKAAIGAAGASATRLKSSALAVVATIGVVDDMTRQLDTANADLQAAVGEMTNGGPPLVTTDEPAPPSTGPAPGAADIPTSLTAVANANVAAAVAAGDTMPKPPVTPVVPPPVVTASTIAAANKANEAAILAAQQSAPRA
jgi:hypothetical protein